MDDIAVVGMGLRFPGRANSAEGLWSVMTEAESQWSAFPSDRLNIQGFYHPSRNRQGSIPFRGAHLLQSDVTKFDAPFFSMTADEAGAVDPQQRMLLEVTYEALENAGLRKEDLDGSPTSVFVGSFVKDYEQVCLRDPDDSPQYAATGNGIALMSNRISYFFNFHGPSETVDTGCSGSLVSIHNAVQSLRAHESSLGIAAGAGLILTPATMMPMTALNFLSPDGKCFTFDDRANGYGRGEGIGVVILKRLSDALRDNDIVRAVIRGSSKNQDGRTLGITLPSAEAQAENIRSAYSVAGLCFTQTGFVECHGTGTQAGDWRELKAISETISKDRCNSSPVVAGSVKPNIGHLEGAAGIAGMIKGVLVLEHGKIPPQANYKTPNPQLELADWKIKIPTTVLDWPLAGLRRVSVNCFGFGGSNVHVIMDDAANYLSSRKLEGQHNTTLDHKGLREPPESKASERHRCTFYPYLFSAPDKLALGRTLKAHLHYLVDLLPSQDGSTFLRDYAYTLACRRSVFPWKAQVVCSSRSDLVKAIKNLDDSSFYRSAKARKRICFAFGGQGAQSPGMGKDLLGSEVFRESLTAASTYMQEHLRSPFILLNEILREGRGSRISNPKIAQPATTAIQIALVELMQSFGISPSHVIGHSSGEIAAAFACGTLTKESAWEVAYWRGFYAAAIPLLAPDEPGAMMAVALGADDMQFFLDQRSESTQIACINSPTSTTLAGCRARIENIAAELKQEGIFHRILPVDVAYHSDSMNLVSGQYEWSLEGITVSSSSQRARMFSTVTGGELSTADLTAKYWAQNMTSQVHYFAALAAMLDSPLNERPDLVIEISPRSQLQSPTLDSMSGIKLPIPIPYLSVAGTQSFDQKSLQACLGSLWQQGGSVNFGGILNENNTMPKCLVDLPTYPWNHTKSYWHESHLSTSIRFRKHGREDLIGVLTPDSTPYEPKWRGFLRVFENPWLQDHKIQKTIVCPAAGMITMVLEAAKQLSEDDTPASGYEITDMTIEKAIIVPETKHGVEVSLNITRPDVELNSSSYSYDRFAIYSKQLGMPWQRNASGHVRICIAPNEAQQTFHTHHTKYESAQSSCTNAIVPRELYEVLDNKGMNYGPSFRNIKELRTSAQTCVSRITIPDTRSKMPEEFEFAHLLHPATLDSMFHTLFAIDSTPMVPIFLQRIFVSGDVAQSDGRDFVGVSEAQRHGLMRASADISMFFDQERRAQVIIEGLEFSRIAMGDSSDAAYVSNNSNLATEITWEKDIAFAIPKSLTELLRLLSHKVPGLSILDLGQDDNIRATVLAAIAPGSGITPRLRRYSLVEPSLRGDLERCKDQLKARGLEDYVDIVDFPTVKSGGFDLILATNYNDMSATQLRPCLSGQGLLICSQPLALSKISCIAEDETILDIHRHSTAPDSGSEDQVTVLIPEKANIELAELINNLRDTIRKSGYQLGLVVTSLSALMADGFSNFSHIVVSLVDLPDGAYSSVYDWDRCTFDFFHALQRQAKRMLWITHGAHRNPSNPRRSPIMGLIRTLISEDPLKRYATLDLGSQTELASPRTSDTILSVLQAVFLASNPATTMDAEYAEEEGRIYIPRLAPIRSLNNLIEPGISSQEISEAPFSTYSENDAAPSVLSHTLVPPGPSMIGHFTKHGLLELGPHEIEVDFQSALLTEQDAGLMLGKGDRDAVGLDVSGRVRHIGPDVPSIFKTDDEITGIVFNGALRSTLHLDHRLARIVPKGFVPSIYISAYYALVHIGRAQKKDIVLIREAASAYGLAAVVVARQLGLELYATITGRSPDDQQRTLEDLGVPRDRIWDEHSIISQDILRQVGRGIDIVYNTLPNSAHTSLLPIRENGYFVQLGQILAHDMAQMRSKGVTLSSFEPYSLIKNNVELASIMLEAALQILADVDSLPVLYTIVQPIGKANEALQELAQAPHSGCALVYSDPGGSSTVNINKSPQIKALSEVIQTEATYLIVGGFLGLGGSIAKLLVKNGARHLVFLSRSGASSGASKAFMKQLQSSGVVVRTVTADVCDATALQAEIEIITDTMPPIHGVFQCAAVISDAVFDNMTFDDWSAAVRCKTLGSWNLVEVLKDTSMDPFYIFLASSAGVIGNRGQANYAAGNSFEDSMAWTLRLQGKHAVSIDLGPVLGAGMLAEDEQILDMLRASGFHSISHEDFLKVLTHAITGEIVEGQPMPPQVVLGVGTGAIIRQNQPADPYWTRTALYSYLNLIDMPAPELSGQAHASSMDLGLRSMLARVSTVAAAGDLIAEGIRGVLAKAMTLLPEEIDTGKPTNAYGVDSLVAIGLRNWVHGQCGVEISLFEVLSELSVAEMGLMIARKGGYGGGSDA